MKCLENSKSRLDLMVSHDWPLGIYQHGNVKELLRKKPFFREEVEQNTLGSPPNRELLDAIKPKRWFSAHLHCKFEATVVHSVAKDLASFPDPSLQLVPSQVGLADQQTSKPDGTPPSANGTMKNGSAESTNGSQAQETEFRGLESSNECGVESLTEQMTRFLALDKCLPRRQYLSIVHVTTPMAKEEARLEYDPEWLAIVRKTHRMTCVQKKIVHMPEETIIVSDEEINWIVERLVERQNDLKIPENFARTVPIYSDSMFQGYCRPFQRMGNPQTDELLSILEMDHSITVPFHKKVPSPAANSSLKYPVAGLIEDENEIDIDEEIISSEEESAIKMPSSEAISSLKSSAEDMIDDENEIDIDEDIMSSQEELPEVEDAEVPLKNESQVLKDENDVDVSLDEDKNDKSIEVMGEIPLVKKARIL
jgi:hypothetical protein